MPVKTRIPLLKDHHSHPSVYAAMNTCVDLRGVADRDEAERRIRQSGDEIVFVLGWNDSLFDFDAPFLDRLPPVFVCNTSLHAYRANRAARRRLAESHPEVIGGIDDTDWVERNLQAIFKLIVAVRGCSAEILTAFYRRLAEQGVGYAEEMLLPNRAVVDAFDEAGLTERTAFWADPDVYFGLDEAMRRRIHGIKLFSDGAVGARTAAMSQPYPTGEEGILLRGDDELYRLLGELSSTGKPVAIHAIGDRAADHVLTALERVRGDGAGFPAIRIEHAQYITLKDARRAKALGVVLCMQPNFSPETIGYRDRLSEAQCRSNNPFRMLIDEVGFVPGDDLILGSDGMPHGAAVALETSLFPPLDAQRLTLEEFVAGYCLGDESDGSIEIEIDEGRRSVAIQEIATRSNLKKHASVWRQEDYRGP